MWKSRFIKQMLRETAVAYIQTHIYALKTETKQIPSSVQLKGMKSIDLKNNKRK